MTESKLLHEYKWTDFPGLNDRISREEVKLFARISAGEATYFIPEDDLEARRKAISGQYEIYDTDPVMSALEETHRRESDSKGSIWDFRPESIPDFSRDEIELKCVISPGGERGMLGRGYSPEDPLDPMLIPFSRIRVEAIEAFEKSLSSDDGSVSLPKVKNPRQSDLDYLIGQFLKKEPDGGRAGLIRFMEDVHDAECLTNEKIRWTDPTGKAYKISIKTLANKLSELKGKRRKLKP